PLPVGPLEADARCGGLRGLELGAELELQRAAELGLRIALQTRIGQRADGRAPVEQRHVRPETAQRLTELEPDDARADDRERSRNVRELEDGIAREDAIAHALEHTGHARRAA